MMRQVAGAFAEYEKTRLVSKLRVARERRRAANGKCEGRKSHAELRPEVVALAKQLRRKRPKGGQRSLREISRELAQLDHFNEAGKPFSAVSVMNLLGQRSGKLPGVGSRAATQLPQAVT